MEHELTGRVFGRLGAFDQPTATGDRVGIPVGYRTFADGYVKYEASLSLHEEDGDLCLAWGEPNFANGRDAERAKAQGAASAWLSAFGRSGVAAPKDVHGRFAVVLIRPAERAVIAATDRFGTFPVCYSATASHITFGERADDIADSNPALSVQGLFDYLFFHVIPAPATVFEGVHRLPAAHAFHWRDGNMTCEPYWRPLFAERTDVALEQQEKEFLNLVEAAVTREAGSVGVGAFLSGGTDSSTIAGMLCKVTGTRARTYSIGFDASGYDEMEYARIAARHFGTDHHEYYVTPDDLLDGIPRVARHYDQPFGNSSAVPAWVCAARARQDGVDKLLAGDGGDELFGGNERYAKQRVFERYDLIPGGIRRLLLEPMSASSVISELPLLSKAASYVNQARVPLPDRLHRYNLLLRAGIEEVLEPSFLAAVNVDEPFATQRDWWNSIDAHSSVDQMIAFDWKYTLADNDLPKVTGAAEIAGINVGFPLLSDDLLEFSLGLPPDWKLKGQTLRWFFKRALRDFLPEAILRKQKHGFGLPFGVWACTHAGLQTYAHDTLNSLGHRAIVSSRFLDKLLGEYLPAHPGYYGEMVWILMMLELWLQDRSPNWRLA